MTSKEKVSEKPEDTPEALDPEVLGPEVPETEATEPEDCLLYTSPSPRDLSTSRMPSSA